MFWVRWIEHSLVRSDVGIVRVKMKPKRLKGLSGVSEEGDGSFSWVCKRLSLSVEFSLSVFCLPPYELAPSGESLLLFICDNGQLHIHIPLLSFFKKIAHMSVFWVYLSLWLCRFVCSECVAGINKVEGTMMVPMRFWHLNMRLLKVNQKHFEPTILILHNFFVFLRWRYDNATPSLCWVFCALLGVLCS